MTAYLGLWFEFQRSDNIPFETGTCVTANYTVRPDGYVNVVNSQYFSSTNYTDSVTGTAQSSTWESGLL